MGHGLQLTGKQWDELDRVRLTTPSADVFRNCLIILMSDSRETISAIAGHLRRSPETVERIRKLYRMGGGGLCFRSSPRAGDRGLRLRSWP